MKITAKISNLPKVLRRTAGSTTAQTVYASAMTAVAGSILSILVVRTLGAAGRGEYSAALIWPALLVYLGNVGFIPAILYHVARVPVPAPEYLTSALWLGIGQSIVAMSVGFLALPILLSSQSAEIVQTSRIGLLLIPPSLWLLYSLAALQATLHFRSYNLLRTAVPLAGLVAVGVISLYGPITVRLLVVIPLLANAAVALLSLWVCRRAGLITLGFPSAQASVELFRYGTKAQAGDLASLSNLRLDQVVLAAFATPAELGRYVIALSICTGLGVVNFSLRSVLQPRVGQFASTGGAVAAIEQGLRRYALFGGISLIMSAIIAPIFLPLVFGDVARSSTLVVSAEVLLLASFLLGIKEMAAGSLQALGDPWLVSRTDIIFAVVTVIGLLVAVWVGGLISIAMVSLVAYGGQAGLLTAFLHRRTGFRISRCLRPGRLPDRDR